MKVQKKQIEMYQLKITKYQGRNIPIEYIDIKEELKKILEYAIQLPMIERKKDFKSDNQILYIQEYTYDETTGIYDIIMASAKYNHRRTVLNTVTFENKGVLKKKEDGDIEYNYLSIRCIGEDIALTSFANNYYGVVLSKVIRYFDDIADKYYKDKLGKSKFYKFEYDIVVDKDFLLRLTQMDKINSIRVTVTKELVSSSEFVQVANINEIKDEVELCFKPVRGASLGFGTVKSFYEKKLTDSSIKRLVVDGKIDGDAMSIDTERLKQKHIIDIEEKYDGSLKPNEIFNKLKKFLGVEDNE